jgi:small subunit ribosomal protein S17
MKEPGKRKHLVGTVSSDKMDKTVVVVVERRERHARYSKFVGRRKKYKAHDEKNEYRVGDVVEIEECRPLSSEKRWNVSRLVERPASLNS